MYSRKRLVEIAKGKYAEWLTEDGLTLIEGWARDGATDADIANYMKIGRQTLYTWMNKYKDIHDAIKKGRAPVDVKVENAVLKSALGYTVTIKKPIKVRKETQKFGEGKVVTEHIEYVDEEVYIAPNFMAQAYWLNNRSRKTGKWTKNQEVITNDTADFSALDEIASQMVKKDGEKKPGRQQTASSEESVNATS